MNPSNKKCLLLQPMLDIGNDCGHQCNRESASKRVSGKSTPTVTASRVGIRRGISRFTRTRGPAARLPTRKTAVPCDRLKRSADATCHNGDRDELGTAAVGV